MDPGHLGPRHRRRDRGNPGAGDGGHRLRGVDRAAAAEGDEALRADLVEQRRGSLGHAPGVDLVDLLGGDGQLAGPGQRPRRAQQLERGEAVLAQQRQRRVEAVLAEDDVAPGVAPDEVAAHSEAEVRGLTTGRSFGSTSARRCS